MCEAEATEAATEKVHRCEIVIDSVQAKRTAEDVRRAEAQNL